MSDEKTSKLTAPVPLITHVGLQLNAARYKVTVFQSLVPVLSFGLQYGGQFQMLPNLRG